jgi:hypothetical protein
MKLSSINSGEAAIPLTRREREEIEKQRSAAAYQKKHAEGKTDEFKVDMERLKEAKKRREESESNLFHAFIAEQSRRRRRQRRRRSRPRANHRPSREEPHPQTTATTTTTSAITFFMLTNDNDRLDARTKRSCSNRPSSRNSSSSGGSQRRERRRTFSHDSSRHSKEADTNSQSRSFTKTTTLSLLLLPAGCRGFSSGVRGPVVLYILLINPIRMLLEGLTIVLW